MRTVRAVVGGVLIAGAAACGGSDSPTGPSDPGGTPGGVGATITITASGITNPNPTISTGQSITVVNNDTRSHNVSSNPHPNHTDCPALNLGDIAAGRQATSNAFTSARSCGYHDHNDPGNAQWTGTITVR